MVTDTTNLDSQLIAERYPDGDLFVCDVSDAILKDISDTLEHPFYSLSKKPEMQTRRYEHRGNWLEITPSSKGLATIYDKDILIYAISQLIAKMNKGEPIDNRVRINTADLLRFTNRGSSGRDYLAIGEALERLRGTQIKTNIRKGDEEVMTVFGLIDSGAVARKFGLDGRLLHIDIQLSEWVMEAIRSASVLTLHRDYFRLRKPLERRIYELGRKHCGQQTSWKCSVEILHKKSGSKSPRKHFRYLLKEIAKTDHLPDYMLTFDGESDSVTFRNRHTMALPATPADDVGPLKPDTFADAREMAPGWDIYYLEGEWRSWMTEAPRNADAAFLGFCRKWFEKRGAP